MSYSGIFGGIHYRKNCIHVLGLVTSKSSLLFNRITNGSIEVNPLHSFMTNEVKIFIVLGATKVKPLKYFYVIGHYTGL